MLRTRSPSFRRLLLIALVLVALVLVWKARNYQRRYTAAEARKASLPIPVGAARAKVSKLETTVGAAGQVLQYTTVTLASKQAALQDANVKLIKAQLDLEATRLTSPVNGIVLARFVNSDERVEVNQVLLQLGDLEKVYLLAQVQDESVGQIHEGQPAEVFFSAYPTTTFKGTIEHVD